MEPNQVAIQHPEEDLTTDGKDPIEASTFHPQRKEEYGPVDFATREWCVEEEADFDIRNPFGAQE